MKLTPVLFFIFQESQLEIVKFLVSQGIHIDARESGTNMTALHYATLAGTKIHKCG